MLFFFFLASAYRAYATPLPLGPEVFSLTPFTFLFARSPCNCGPQERTLFEVIRSCVLTIFACVYTSLHPNVPDPKATKSQKFFGRLKMAFYMLIAPEAVIWWAMRQWYGAREIAKQVTKRKPDLKWTTTHGHFAQMGGIQGIFPDGHRQVIDPWDMVGSIAGATHLVRALVDPNELRFPREQVEDRSKGDFLSKGLVALQTSWFILECIARVQQQLPITELEVVTLAFAVLNIITYGFWWDKPLNVNCQVQVHIHLDPEQLVGGSDGDENRRGGEEDIVPREIGEDGRQHGIWQRLAVRPFFALVLPIRDMFTCDKIKAGARHVPTFYATPFLSYFGTLLQIRLIICLVGMLFGGIHFLAWHSHFPTHTELILWRSSSLVIVVIPFLVGLFGILGGRLDWEFEWNLDQHSGFKFLFELLKAVLFTLGPTLYILARLSLVVQAFFSLRALSPDVFKAVTWTSYIPHL